MTLEHLHNLMDRILVTIDGDMDFSSYTKEELDWFYEYCMDYQPEGYETVVRAILSV